MNAIHPGRTPALGPRTAGNLWWGALLVVATSSLAWSQGDALADLQKALQQDVSRDRQSAAIEAVGVAAQQGRIKPDRAAKVLHALLGKAELAELEPALVSALGRLDERTAVDSLLERSITSESEQVRAIAWDRLRRNPGAAVEPALAKALAAKPWAIRAQAALLLCERGAFDRIDDLIAVLKDEKHQAVLAAVGEALEKLTLKILPVSHEAWKRWRAENPSWNPAATAAEPPGSGAEPATPPDGGAAGGETVVVVREPLKARAYGIVPRFEHFEVEGEVVLLLVDVSGSMVRDGARSIQDARSLIHALPSHTEVMLLCFTETLAYADERFAPLGIARKHQLDQFLVARREAGGGTDLESALLAGLDRAQKWFEGHPKDPRELDIIVFSDGKSSEQGRVARIPAEKVVRELEKQTQRRVVRMSTIGSTGVASGLMVRLAELSGGYVVLGEKLSQEGLK